jgi:hypothetical protein
MGVIVPREESQKAQKTKSKTIKIDFIFILQGCYCERLITPGNGQAGSKQGRDGDEKLVRIPLSPTLYIFLNLNRGGRKINRIKDKLKYQLVRIPLSPPLCIFLNIIWGGRIINRIEEKLNINW